MTRFFTADQHFGHTKMLQYEAENRRDQYGHVFQTVEKMDDYLIDQWNATVAPGDVVYCLGDFSMKMQILSDVLPFLNGVKILIVGNHDPFWKRLIGTTTMPRDRAAAVKIALEVGFSEVHMEIKIDLPDIGLVRLSHFPYAPPVLEGLPDHELRHIEHHPVSGKEALLLHGHIHGKWFEKTYPGMPPMLNVGVDVWGMRPVSEMEIAEWFRRIERC